jgi:hypothetical protein
MAKLRWITPDFFILDDGTMFDIRSVIFRKSKRDSFTDRLKVWVEGGGLRSRVVTLDYTGKHAVNSWHKKLEAELQEELKIHRALGVHDG